MSRDIEILQLAREGHSYREIGELFGISRARVSQICVENGFIKRPFDVNLKNVRQITEFSNFKELFDVSS